LLLLEAFTAQADWIFGFLTAIQVWEVASARRNFQLADFFEIFKRYL